MDKIIEKISHLTTTTANYSNNVKDKYKNRDGWAARVEKAVQFIEWLKPEGRVLDFGCGPGIHIAVAKEMGYYVHGLDVEGNRYHWEHIWQALGIEDQVVCVEDGFVSWPCRNLDTIYALSSLWKHLEDDFFQERVFRNRFFNVSNSLTDEGTLIVNRQRDIDTYNRIGKGQDLRNVKLYTRIK